MPPTPLAQSVRTHAATPNYLKLGQHPMRRGMALAAASRFTRDAQVLRLSFHSKSGATPAPPVEMSDLRVSAGSLWDPLQHGLVATYSGGSWMHHGRSYPAVCVTGGGCLLFGITRDPTIVSDPIEHFYFIGPTLSANGVAIAKYVEQQETWHGLVRPMWWRAMRIITAAGISALVDEAQLVLLNPWEPHPSHGRLPDYLREERTNVPATAKLSADR